MSTATLELKESSFNGLDFKALTGVIAQSFMERPGTIAGLPSADKIDSKIPTKVPGRLAREMLGDFATFQGSALETLEELVYENGLIIGFAPEGSLEKDERVQMSTGLVYAALNLGVRMNRLAEVQKPYETGWRQGTLEGKFVLPDAKTGRVSKAKFHTLLSAHLPSKQAHADFMRIFCESEVFPGDTKSLRLSKISERMRHIYLNMPRNRVISESMTSFIDALFQGKDKKTIQYDTEFGLASGEALRAQWDGEREAYIESPMTDSVTRSMACEKMLHAIAATQVYGKQRVDQLQASWVGTAIGKTIDYLKPRDQAVDTFYTPFQILMRLSIEARHRITREKVNVSDLQFAEAIIRSVPVLFKPDDLKRYQSIIEEKVLTIAALRTEYAKKQLALVNIQAQAAEAMGDKSHSVAILKEGVNIYPARAERDGIQATKGQRVMVRTDKANEYPGWVPFKLGSQTWYWVKISDIESK